MSFTIGQLGVYNPLKRTISTAITKSADLSRLPQSRGFSLPAKLRVNKLDGFGSKWGPNFGPDAPGVVYVAPEPTAQEVISTGRGFRIL